MKYYSEKDVEGLLNQMDSHFVKYLENLPSIEIKEPHGDLIERDGLSLNYITDYNLEGHAVVELEDVLNAPTVLEASAESKCDDCDEIGIEDEYNCSTCYQPGDVCLLNGHKIAFLGYDKNNPTEKAPSPVGDFDPRFWDGDFLTKE